MTTSPPTTSPLTTDRVLLTGAVVLPDHVVADGVVAVEDGLIAYAGRRAGLPADWATAPSPEGWHDGLTLWPGLVDGHCHGGNGGEFGPDSGSAERAARHHHAAGSTTVIGSLVSAPAATLLAGARALAPLVASGLLGGIHLEGPFLSTARRGAQNPVALTDADPGLLAGLVEAAGPGAIVHLTFAPERDPAGVLPRALAEAGITASLGHTDTDFAGAAAALSREEGRGVRGGLPLVTHVFNGMPPLLSRAPGPVGAALAAAARGEAVLEAIADGVHLDPGTVRMLHDLAGPGHLVLVSDAMAACGLPDGDYALGGLPVQVHGREARLAEGGSIAGGVSTLAEQVRWCVQDLGIPLADAVASAATTPARALGLEGVGALVEGHHADVLVVDADLVVQRVLRRGSWLRQAPAPAPPALESAG